MFKKQISEFRKDLVSGDWILIAPGRRRRPHFFGKAPEKVRLKKTKESVKTCPFEDPQRSGNPPPILWYPRPGTPPKKRKEFPSWFIQVVPNKYSLLSLPFEKSCPLPKFLGLQQVLKGVGFHEVVITRDHFKTIDKMTLEEVELIIRAYQTRYQTLMSEPCINYILIFHNQGQSAGASIPHPHSQLIAIPTIDPDISRSLAGSAEYYKRYKKCIHCSMVEWELEKGKRIIYKNKHFVTLAPFAPRISYETRIYPLYHASRFEEISDEGRYSLADSLRDAIKRIVKTFKEIDYNFFIHTAPLSLGDKEINDHYHWHIEIIPRSSIWAGLELGVGIEVVSVPPEESAEVLRKAI